MYKIILVPLDGSKRAEAILPHIENLAQCYQAKVTSLQVVEPLPLIARVNPMSDIQAYEQWMKTAEIYLAAQAKSFIPALKE